MESFLLALLISSNVAWTFFYIFKKPKKSKQVVAIERVIAAFEVEGQSILQITKISPDSVYLRSMGRQ